MQYLNSPRNTVRMKPRKPGARPGPRRLGRHKIVDGVIYQLHATRGWKKVGRVSEQAKFVPGFADLLGGFVRAFAKQTIPVRKNFAALTPVRVQGSARGR